MEIKAEILPIYIDNRVNKPLYAHQKYILDSSSFKKMKLHMPTSAGKTLSAVLFALRDTYKQGESIRAILTYPTNLLSKDQFDGSVVRGLTEWVGAELKSQGFIEPYECAFQDCKLSFSELRRHGAPTYIFVLPEERFGKKRGNLYLTVLTGEILRYLFSLENIVRLGKRKGTYLLNILRVLNQHDHILITSPDLLGYVAQQCYSASGGYYSQRWRDELTEMLSEHKVVVDEYHFYDPYTYINLLNTLDRIEAKGILLLSATGIRQYFDDADEYEALNIEKAYINSKIGDKIASYPITLFLHNQELLVPESFPQYPSIYFYNSVVTAHEYAHWLRGQKVPLTEWSGIEKITEKNSNLTIATSAAEVGLDLPFIVVHTEFWGNDYEIKSLIQRIGRVGRKELEANAEAHVYVTGRESNLISEICNCPSINKTEFAESLLRCYGETSFRLEDYASYYFWDPDKTNQIRRFWQIQKDTRLRFYFRPPNSQAVFDWNGVRFAYDWIPVANRYHVEKVKELTEEPFWGEMGLSEWKVLEPKQNRDHLKPYMGKKDKEYRQLFLTND